MGEYNLFNAVSYCNYAKYLMILNELKPAAENLGKAVQIFACLSNDHPINWVIHFANGVFYEQKNNYDEASKLFRSCLDMAVRKFDSSHITIKKVRLRIAKTLLKQSRIDESFKELEQLEEEVEDDLAQSRLKIEVTE
jgi:tetratricopeptide (TPR) repeat protein